MSATATDYGTERMNESERQLQELHKQLQTLHQNLRTVRHAVNNNVAVIMAMAELTQRNPNQCARLSQLCLEKAPQISAAISGFSELMDSALNLQQELEHQARHTA